MSKVWEAPNYVNYVNYTVNLTVSYRLCVDHDPLQMVTAVGSIEQRAVIDTYWYLGKRTVIGVARLARIALGELRSRREAPGETGFTHGVKNHRLALNI